MFCEIEHNGSLHSPGIVNLTQVHREIAYECLCGRTPRLDHALEWFGMAMRMRDTEI